MTLRILDTLSGERVPFEPADPDNVLLYYCGLTVSDTPHLGHARSWIHVDIIHRWLEYLEYSVRHVENITDVNEKIVARVGEDTLGDSEAEVARHFTNELLECMRSLNLKRAEVYPRVSEHIPEIRSLIETLMDKGYAYESAGSVYFDVTSFPEYGKLSNQQLDELEAQADSDNRRDKRHPADFALWKANGVDSEAITEHRHADRQYAIDHPKGQSWDAPWGTGRPGWHIECSAMAMAHLDTSIDIHIGGRDLVFPHHENEIAQSEAATGEQFVSYWLHTDLLQIADEKMSSSLQNFITVPEALEEFGSNVLRMFFLSATYNSSQTFSDAAMEEAFERWERLESTVERVSKAAMSPDATSKVESDLPTIIEDVQESFSASMNDDFNTRKALVSLFDLANAANRHLEEGPPYDYQGLHKVLKTFDRFGGQVLGFSFMCEPDGSAGITTVLVDLLLEVRERERDAGNYDLADTIRAELESLGIQVQDTEDGVDYRFN